MIILIKNEYDMKVTQWRMTQVRPSAGKIALVLFTLAWGFWCFSQVTQLCRNAALQQSQLKQHSCMDSLGPWWGLQCCLFHQIIRFLLDPEVPLKACSLRTWVHKILLALCLVLDFPTLFLARMPNADVSSLVIQTLGGPALTLINAALSQLSQHSFVWVGVWQKEEQKPRVVTRFISHQNKEQRERENRAVMEIIIILLRHDGIFPSRRWHFLITLFMGSHV